jgi:hypothetical protein
MTTDSHLINKFGEELFYPKYQGTSDPKTDRDYELDEIGQPGLMADDHYDHAYRRFANIIDKDGRGYERLSQMEENLAARAENLNELADARSEALNDFKQMLDIPSGADSIAEVVQQTDRGSWTLKRAQSIDSIPPFKPPSIVIVEEYKENNNIHENVMLVFRTPESEPFGPCPKDISYLYKAARGIVLESAEDFFLARLKASLAEITLDALEDVLFQYEVSGSVRSLPEPNISRNDSENEKGTPGRNPNLTDEQLESYVRRAEDIKDKPAEEMSHRELARVLKEEVSDDIPYTQSSLRKRLSDFSRD